MPGRIASTATQQARLSDGLSAGPPLASDRARPAAAVTGLTRATGCSEPASRLAGAYAELMKASTMNGKNSNWRQPAHRLLAGIPAAELEQCRAVIGWIEDRLDAVAATSVAELPAPQPPSQP